MDELNETETLNEADTKTDTIKERKELKDSKAFKFLIYVLFFISCAATLIFGYFVMTDYYMGAYEEDSTATNAVFESMVSNASESEIYDYEHQLVYNYLDDVLSVYYVDNLDLVDFTERMDANGDNVVDETDLKSYISDNADKFCDYYDINSDYIDSVYAYVDTEIEISINDEVVTSQQYSSVPDAETVDYEVYQDTYYADLVEIHWQYLGYVSAYDAEELAAYYDDYYDNYVYYSGGWYANSELEVCEDGSYRYYYAVYAYDEVPIDYTISIYTYVPDFNSAYYVNNSDYSIYKEFIGYGDDFAVAFFISLIACICFMVFSMILAGDKKSLRRFEKIPAELMLAGLFVLAFALIYMMDEININIYSCLNITRYVMKFLNGSIISEGLLIFVFLIGAACLVTVGLLLVNNLIVRIKKNKLADTFLCVRAFKALFRFLRTVFSKISFSFKFVISYIFITVVEVVAFSILLEIDEDGVFVFAFIIFKVVAVLLLVTVIYALQVLFKGGDSLAKGDYSYKVDTKYMWGDFKKHGENLNNINEGVQAAVDEKMKSERMKTELITNVSHDIKTPVTSIVNYVDLLEKENVDHEPERSYIEVLKRQSLRLKKLVEDLVEASKASAGNISMEFALLDVNMLIEQAAAEYVDKLSEKNISLIMKLSSDKASVMADGKYLWRVFDNLLGNANKYTMPSTRMYINTYITDSKGSVINNIETSMSEPAKVVIEFKNISKDELNISSDEIMERFVRGDSSRNTEGSGLGLSIAKNLCQLQNATFDIIIDGDLFKAQITFPYSAETTEK